LAGAELRSAPNIKDDDSFAQEGAKIGQSLRIRLPNQYTTTTGASLGTPNNTVEIETTLTVSTQRHVPLRFTAVELTMSLDDFSDRIIKPAMAVLAAAIEADALSMHRDVYYSVNNLGAPIGARQVLLAKKRLMDSLAPEDDSHIGLINTQDNVDLVDTLKGLFQSSSNIGEQYRKGLMGQGLGFDFYQNTLLPTQTTGTALAATTYTVNGANQVGSSITVATGSTTFAIGDIVTFAGCNEVHPETKADTGRLQQFVVTAAYAGGAGNLQVSPAIVTSGGRQNVTASPTNGGAVVKVGGAGAIYRPSLFFHPDAFTFATADLVMPKGVDMAARSVQDGISMRLVRQYDINEDRMPCRIDVLYGFRTIRPELACRVLSN
jgi:hypothetical protein